MTGLIDIHGQPLRRVEKLDKRALREEQATPTLTGVRTTWSEPVASGLTPNRLARILRDSEQPGADLTDYLTLCEEMEERDPQYRMALGQRKLAIRNIETVIEPASEDESDKQIADEVRKLIDTTQFRNIIVHLADGLAKGFAVAEIVWEIGTVWKPQAIKSRDPRWFQFDRLSGRELRLRVDGEPEGRELPAAKYLIHTPVLKSGIPIRAGLARTAVWIFMLKAFTLRDWMAFLEVYGMPFRVGKYDSGATDADKRALLRAVANVAADGGAIIPKEMLLEFIESKANASGDNAYRGMSEYLDELFAKLVNGQTMTSDNGSSLSQAEVHNDIRLMILRADCDELAATIQRDLVEHYVRFNHGEPKNGFPQVTFPVPDPEDLQALLAATKTFVDMGGKVPAGPVREKLGWRDPIDGEEVLGGSPKPPVPPGRTPAGKTPPGKSPAETEAMRRLRTASEALSALADDPLTGFAAGLADDWEPQIDPLLKAVRSAVMQASNYDDLEARLLALAGTTDLSELISRLRAAMFAARIEGGNG